MTASDHSSDIFCQQTQFIIYPPDLDNAFLYIFPHNVDLNNYNNYAIYSL